MNIKHFDFYNISATISEGYCDIPKRYQAAPLTVCFCHVIYTCLECSESTLCTCLNVQERLAGTNALSIS